MPLDIQPQETSFQVIGQLTANESAQLESFLQSVLQIDVDEIILDLSQVEQLDITCLQLFVAAFKSADALGKMFLFQEISETVKHVLVLSGLNPMFINEPSFPDG